MAEGKTWTFQQLTGPKKSFALDGWAAPLGRPRQGAVVRDGVKVATQLTHYPGAGPRPTRHIFHHSYLPWEISGRLRDRAHGPGFAKAMVATIKAFVADKQPIRITWGDVRSVQGFIDEFDPGFESEGEVEWTMKISVDWDDNFDKKVEFNPVNDTSIADTSGILDAFLQSMLSEMPEIPEDLSSLTEAFNELANFPGNVAGTFNEALEGPIDAVASVTGSLATGAQGIADFEKATAGQLNKFSASLHQTKTAVLTLKGAYVNAHADTALVQERMNDNVALWSSQTVVEELVRETLAFIAKEQRRIKVALTGKTKTTYVAKRGDSWESISTAFFGTPARAGDIREANSTQAGESPIPGREYLIPK